MHIHKEGSKDTSNTVNMMYSAYSTCYPVKVGQTIFIVKKTEKCFQKCVRRRPNIKPMSRLAHWAILPYPSSLRPPLFVHKINLVLNKIIFIA